MATFYVADRSTQCMDSVEKPPPQPLPAAPPRAAPFGSLDGHSDATGGRRSEDSGLSRPKTAGPVIAFAGFAATQPPVTQEDVEDRGSLLTGPI